MVLVWPFSSVEREKMTVPWGWRTDRAEEWAWRGGLRERKRRQEQESAKDLYFPRCGHGKARDL